jgi:hypothetical protein
MKVRASRGRRSSRAEQNPPQKKRLTEIFPVWKRARRVTNHQRLGVELNHLQRCSTFAVRSHRSGQYRPPIFS